MSQFFKSRFTKRRASVARSSVRVATRHLAQLSPVWLSISVVGVMALLYVWQITLLATTGYELGTLGNTESTLKERIASLQVEVLDNSVLTRIEERVQESNFVPETSAQHMSASELAGTLSRR